LAKSNAFFLAGVVDVFFGEGVSEGRPSRSEGSQDGAKGGALRNNDMGLPSLDDSQAASGTRKALNWV